MERNRLNIKIGGEFDISPNSVVNIKEDIITEQPFLFSNGRSALLSILMFLKTRNHTSIFLPSYICESVVNTCKGSGIDLNFYELDNQFFFPLETLSLIPENSILLSVNYFGLINDNDLIASIKQKRPDLIVISDQVQSMWTADQSVAHFSFTSHRKHFATPDGAQVFTNFGDWESSPKLEVNSFYSPKTLGGILKNQNASDSIYLNLFEKGENLIDNEKTATKASVIGYHTYHSINQEEIISQRKDNAKHIYEIGKKAGINFIFPLSNNSIPLAIPILITDRNKVWKQLAKNGIYLPIHWPISSYNSNSELATNMASNELSLINDQRYSAHEIEHQMTTLINIIGK